MKKKIKVVTTQTKTTSTVATTKKVMNFNWVQLKKLYKNDEAGLEAFITAAKNDIAKLLIVETKKRKMVQDLTRKCASQSCFNQIIRGPDDVWGELFEVMTTTIKRWEKYCREIVSNNKQMQHATKEGSLRMATEDDIVGYYRNSAKNAFADLFIHHRAQKRAAPEVNFSSLLTKNDEENEKSYEEGIVCQKSNKISYNQNKAEMIKTLRAYDKKQSKKTSLARVFVALMNPRHKGAVTVIQKKLKLNNKTFNETKESIAHILRESFGDCRKEIIDFLDTDRGMFDDLEQGNKASRQYENRAEQKLLEKNTPKPCRLNVIYGQRMHPTSPNKRVYYAMVQVQRCKTAKIIAYSPDNWESIYNKEEKIEGKENQLSQYRPKLEKLMKKQIEEAKKLVSSNGNFEINPSIDLNDESLAA
jgi:hypothetical protein